MFSDSSWVPSLHFPEFSGALCIHSDSLCDAVNSTLVKEILFYAVKFCLFFAHVLEEHHSSVPLRATSYKLTKYLSQMYPNKPKDGLERCKNGREESSRDIILPIFLCEISSPLFLKWEYELLRGIYRPRDDYICISLKSLCNFMLCSTTIQRLHRLECVSGVIPGTIS
ncbi:unnamed protein product [Hymenolepis diminuta]|uniref:Uncharacterized protein n=1 Tax=Hymenolepis diminuta TaxID=6216 RepID=A0A564XUX0_HYMDI|nr:unnamed protein product [Hymenolepis diminuta]